MKISKKMLLEELISNGLVDFYTYFKKPDSNDSKDLKDGQTRFLAMLENEDKNQLYISKYEGSYFSLIGLGSGFRYATHLSNNKEAILKLQKWANENNFKIVDEPNN